LLGGAAETVVCDGPKWTPLNFKAAWGTRNERKTDARPNGQNGKDEVSPWPKGSFDSFKC